LRKSQRRRRITTPVVVELVEDMVEVKEEDGVAGKEAEEDAVAAEAVKEDEDGAERGAAVAVGVIVEDGVEAEAGAEGEGVTHKISSLFL
jgi:hypothetical protein